MSVRAAAAGGINLTQQDHRNAEETATTEKLRSLCSRNMSKAPIYIVKIQLL